MNINNVRHGNLIAKDLKSWAEKEYQRVNKGGLRPWDENIAREFHALTKSIEGLEILLDDDYFLGLHDTIFPAHREDIYDFWERKYINNENITLVIFLEGIGSGKSSKFSILSWLQWFELTTKCDIAKYYRTLPDEITAFINMSRSEVQAKKIVMSKVMARFKNQFNREYFPPNPRKGQEIFIERNLTAVFAGTSSAASSLGYNIYGGAVDECLTGGTEITLDTGNEKIKDLVGKKNISLPSFNVESGQLEEAVADEVVCRGEKDVFELVLEDGTILEATENHRFLCKTATGKYQYKTVSEIQEGDDLVKY